MLCYQDFKDTFVCNTQPSATTPRSTACCVIRISKILLYAIHNHIANTSNRLHVVLSGFQRYFCMQYTTSSLRISSNMLLCYQDFKDTFVCNTQLVIVSNAENKSCVIRISKILLYAIHNCVLICLMITFVVLSGFQRYFCMQYTTIALPLRRC